MIRTSAGVLQAGLMMRNLALGLTLMVTLGVCWPSASAIAAGPEDLNDWAEGPVRWLLQSTERREIRQVQDPEEAAAFIAEFWSRRDLRPGEPGNPYREAYEQRVAAADVLYAEEGIRGSLTARGRALILLGSPTHLSITTRPALAWDTQNPDDQGVTTERMSVEVWGYRREDLPASVLRAWLARAKGGDEPLTLTLTFRMDRRRSQIMEGENLLDLASRAAVVEE
jgi:GWxTD domain-containing protein